MILSSIAEMPVLHVVKLKTSIELRPKPGLCLLEREKFLNILHKLPNPKPEALRNNMAPTHPET